MNFFNQNSIIYLFVVYYLKNTKKPQVLKLTTFLLYEKNTTLLHLFFEY